MSDDDLAEARKELEKEYAQARQDLAPIERAYQTLMDATPEDNLSEMLEDLEDAVHQARTGGLLGSGANGHRRALDDYLKIKMARGGGQQ